MKEKAVEGGPARARHAAPRGGQANREGQALSRQIALTALWALIGLLVPRAGVYGGVNPFGVGFASAVPGAGAAAVYMTTVIGYLLPGGTALPLRYIAAVAAVAGIRWSLSGVKGLTGKALFAPTISFLGVVSTGIAMAAVEGLSAFRILTVIAEALLAGGSAYFFRRTVEIVEENAANRRVLTVQEQSSVVVTGAVVLMAISGISFSGISPGRIASVVLILLLARCGREQGGAVSGIVLGLAMSLAAPDHAYLAAAYSFGGLLAGMFSRFGRFASAGAFIMANTIVAISAGAGVESAAGTAVIVGVYEVAAASILYVVMPSSADRKINAFFTRGARPPAMEGLRQSVVMRLDFASKAMEEVASTVESVSKKLTSLSAPDLSSVYQSVSDDVCRVCGLRMNCWESAYSDTMAALNDMTPILREKGRITAAEAPGRLARRCSRLDEVVARVNAGYIEYAVREGAWRRLAELRGMVTDQFASMSELLGELSEDFTDEDRVETDASTRVAEICEDYGLKVQDAVCTIGRGDRMRVEILAKDTHAKLNQKEWERELGDACGREFGHPVVTRLSDRIKITLNEKTALRVSLGKAQLTCSGERLCGDAYDTFTDGGRLYAVLSDGMGSGGRAAVDGAMASGLITRLLQAGFGADSALRMVNSALMVKSGDESIATVDIAAVDLFTGRLQCLKAGAAPSFLCSKGRVSRIERSALPVGILRDISFERTDDTLVEGDVLLVVSDGVLSEGLEWVEDLLLEHEETDMQRLADSIAAQAREKQKDTHEDDITVLALRVEKAG